jgi:hypothetical protein
MGCGASTPAATGVMLPTALTDDQAGCSVLTLPLSGPCETMEEGGQVSNPSTEDKTAAPRPSPIRDMPSPCRRRGQRQRAQSSPSTKSRSSGSTCDTGPSTPLDTPDRSSTDETQGHPTFQKGFNLYARRFGVLAAPIRINIDSSTWSGRNSEDGLADEVPEPAAPRHDARASPWDRPIPCTLTHSCTIVDSVQYSHSSRDTCPCIDG